MKKPALDVFAERTQCGRLDRSDRDEDTVLFTYRDGCAPESAVSLTMPVRADQYDAMGGVLPIFEMNLPEGALKERLRREFAKAIPAFDDLDLLSIVGSSQIGRLRYAVGTSPPEDIPSQSLEEILTYRGATDLFGHLLELYARYSGISGVQPKVLVRDEKAPAKVAYRGATHIVKAFDAGEYPQLAANEFICTRGAAAAGIVTARLQLSRDGRLLIADRFDRDETGGYHGVEDFCVLEGRRAHGRYDGSYEGIARRIADFVSPQALLQAREQYALMVAYACAIENGDAHLKNFCVIYQHPESDVRLAPAFDIVSTTPYLPRDTLALTLNGSKRFPERASLITFIRSVTGKTERAAVQLLEQVVRGVHAAMGEAKVYGRKHKDARAFAEHLNSALCRGLDRLGAEGPAPGRRARSRR